MVSLNVIYNENGFVLITLRSCDFGKAFMQ